MSDHTEGIEVDFNYCEVGHLVGYDGYCDECANEASPDTNAEQSLKELVDGTRETIKIAMAAATQKVAEVEAQQAILDRELFKSRMEDIYENLAAIEKLEAVFYKQGERYCELLRKKAEEARAEAQTPPS